MIRKLMLVILTAILFSAQSNAGTRKAVQRGLDWLIQQQHPKGYWGSYNREHHRVAMTSLAGMALLMEGSTLSAGKYLKPLRKAVKWILKCSRREEEVDGLIYADNAWHSDNHYMFGHGYALLFLASAYGEENRPWMRRQIQDALFRAVKLSSKAQTRYGGWGYNVDSGGFDEVSVTLTQIQGLRAAAQSGIAIPENVIKNARRYLHLCTASEGGVLYDGRRRLQQSRGLAVSSVNCAFSPEGYRCPLVIRWLEEADRAVPAVLNRGLCAVEFHRFYIAQTIHSLGENGAEKLSERLKGKSSLVWSKFRAQLFNQLIKQQRLDGSWASTIVDSIYSTSVNLCVLQLEKRTLPIFRIRRQDHR